MAAVPQTDALKTGNVHKNSTVQTIDGPLRLTTDDNTTPERTPHKVHAQTPTHVHTADASRCCTFFGGTQLDVGSSAAGGATRCILVDCTQFFLGYIWEKNSIRYGTMGGTRIGDVRVLGCNEVSYMSLRNERVAEDSVQT